MRLIDEGVIFEGTPGTPTANCGFGAIAQMPDRTLLATWRVGSDKTSHDGNVWLSRSSDDGRHWEPPGVMLPTSEFAGRRGTLLYAPLTVLGQDHLLATATWVDWPDPSIPFFDTATEEHLPVHALLAESHDAGRSWDAFRQVDAEPYESHPLVCGPTHVMHDGRWSCWFEADKGWSWHHAVVTFSGDEGKTWGDAVDVAHDPSGRYYYWDQRCDVGREGYCVAMFWTHDTRERQDVNIHISESTDGGRSWSAPRETPLRGQVAHPVLLPDGRLLVVYVDRFGAKTIRACVSGDGGAGAGKTFAGEELVIYRHGPSRPEPKTDKGIMDSGLYTFGRPDALVDPDGSVWVVYYAGDDALTRMHWARLEV